MLRVLRRAAAAAEADSLEPDRAVPGATGVPGQPAPAGEPETSVASAVRVRYEVARTGYRRRRRGARFEIDVGSRSSSRSARSRDAVAGRRGAPLRAGPRVVRGGDPRHRRQPPRHRSLWSPSGSLGVLLRELLPRLKGTRRRTWHGCAPRCSMRGGAARTSTAWRSAICPARRSSIAGLAADLVDHPVDRDVARRARPAGSPVA